MVSSSSRARVLRRGLLAVSLTISLVASVLAVTRSAPTPEPGEVAATGASLAACPDGFTPMAEFLANERRVEAVIRRDAVRDLRAVADEGLDELAEEGLAPEGCVSSKHPEPFGELYAAARDHAMVRSAPSGYDDGAFAAAVAQRQAMATTAVAGTSGQARQYGKGPLRVDDERYGSVNGLGLVKNTGRVDDLEYDAANGRLFAAVGTGGVWMSTDLARSWTPIGDNLPSTVIGSVAWTTANGGTLVAVSGDPTFGGITGFPGSGAYHTTDLGKSWKKSAGVPDGALGFRVAVDPTDPKVVYVATSKGLFRSTDGGVSFANVNLPTGTADQECTGVTDVTAHPECTLANIVTDVVVQAPGGTTNVEEPKVVAAVGWRGGSFANPDGTIQSPNNGIYISDTGAPGSFQKSAASGFTSQERIGRIELGAATGPDQDHGYLYAMVQDAVILNGGCIAIDIPCGPGDVGGAPTGISTVLEGVYVSSDFGASWTRVANAGTFQSPTTGSALNGTFQALGYQPGVQAWYNQFIVPDPTKQLNGVPTRLVLGLEEVWENEQTGPLTPPVMGPTTFKVIGRYFAGDTCLALSLGIPCATNRAPQNSTTTHPDQHSALFVPGADGGVTLVVGNDGGVFTQTVAADGDFDNGGWGEGANDGFQTLLPYNAAMARDGVAWFGLQDNGTGKIIPSEDFKQVETYGGDGFFVAVDPNDSDIAYSETPGAAMRVTTDGGVTWSGVEPPAEGGPYRFSNPFAMDPNHAQHLVTAGTKVYDSNFGAGSAGQWAEVFDLGTASKPGDPDAAPSATDPDNTMSAIDVERDAVYVGFCGVCDILNASAPFKNGIATNVAGAKPQKRMSTDGWHVAAAKGLPNRFITSVAIDPSDPRTVYVTLGGYSRKWASPGTLQDDNPNVGEGHVYKSTDAGQTFFDVSGNLPDATATWVEVRGKQLLVGTDVGAFASASDGSPTYAPLAGIPPTPIGNIQLKPHDPNTAVVATYGRGVWTYTFDEKVAIPGYRRIAGANRFATAVATSKEQFRSADTVVIARADAYADALAGVPLAAWRDAPILLASTGGIDAGTRAEIQRLGAKRAVILGGAKALGSAVETQLRAAGVTTIQRLSGPSRYATAARIAKELPNTEHVYVVKGGDADPNKGWADALSVGPLAAYQGHPILLTETDRLPAETLAALDELGVESLTIVGGTAVVSPKVRDQLSAAVDGNVREIAGTDRYDTSAKVADVAEAVGLSDFRVWLTTGANWPDALAAGAAATVNGGPVVLVPSDDLRNGKAVDVWLGEHARDIELVRFLGGEKAVSSRVVGQVRDRIAAGPPKLPPAPPIVGETLAGPYGFETGEEGWTTATTGAMGWRVQPPGDGSAQSFAVTPYSDETTATLTSPGADFAGGRVKLSWSARYNTEECCDFFTVQWSSDGKTFTTVYGDDGLNPSYPLFDRQEVEFVAPAGQVFVRFVVSSDALVSGEGAYVDDVLLER